MIDNFRSTHRTPRVQAPDIITPHFLVGCHVLEVRTYLSAFIGTRSRNMLQRTGMRGVYGALWIKTQECYEHDDCIAVPEMSLECAKRSGSTNVFCLKPVEIVTLETENDGVKARSRVARPYDTDLVRVQRVSKLKKATILAVSDLETRYEEMEPYVNEYPDWGEAEREDFDPDLNPDWTIIGGYSLLTTKGECSIELRTREYAVTLEEAKMHVPGFQMTRVDKVPAETEVLKSFTARGLPRQRRPTEDLARGRLNLSRPTKRLDRP